MEKIDGNDIDPYFILDVVETDDITFITKAFKKKAKMWHPDKMSKENLLDPIKVERTKNHFKLLVQSYEYIINKMRYTGLNSSKKETIDIPKSKNIDYNSSDLNSKNDSFNKEFEKLQVSKPTDFGYDTKRLANIEEYDKFNHKPDKITFQEKKFNNDEFNNIFEYQQAEQESQPLTPYDTTNDGFSAYNGGNLGCNSFVSSYNGIMITGDTFGQSGIGYYDTTYSDYKNTFSSSKNPTSNLKIPTDYKPSEKQFNNEKIGPDNTDIKTVFENKESSISLKQQQQKLEQDKKIILEYKHLYSDQTLIENAFDGNLINNTKI